MNRDNIVTIDDITEWFCLPHKDKPDEWCTLVAVCGEMIISAPLRLSTPPASLHGMLAKFSAATWMLAESAGLLGFRESP